MRRKMPHSKSSRMTGSTEKLDVKDLMELGRGAEIGTLSAMLFIKGLCAYATADRLHLRDAVLSLVGATGEEFPSCQKGRISGFCDTVETLLTEGARFHSDRYERLDEEALCERIDLLLMASADEYRLGVQFSNFSGDERDGADLMKTIVTSPLRKRSVLVKVAKRIAAESGRNYRPFSDAVDALIKNPEYSADTCGKLERLLQEIPSGEA